MYKDITIDQPTLTNEVPTLKILELSYSFKEIKF